MVESMVFLFVTFREIDISKTIHNIARCTYLTSAQLDVEPHQCIIHVRCRLFLISGALYEGHQKLMFKVILTYSLKIVMITKLRKSHISALWIIIFTQGLFFSYKVYLLEQTVKLVNDILSLIPWIHPRTCSQVKTAWQC